MPAYRVSVTIENKPGIADPEGATILNDLVLRRNFASVSEVRTAKTLRFTIDGKDGAEAEKTVKRLCDELRIYNPLVSMAAFRVRDARPDQGPPSSGHAPDP